ncbi:MAG: YdbL family protein [Gammaproteobacteria bacterium]|nr:YdbL family protein [Gammaproteobacteria bacterium]
MKHKSILSSSLFGLALSACVTINIYFPAAAAEDAARVIVRDVLNEEEVEVTKEKQEPNDQSNVESFDSLTYVVAGAVLNMLISPAHAEADININTPAIGALRNSLKARAGSLKPHYTSGAVGLTANAEVQIRDQSLIALKDRNQVKKLVADENKERGALYAEIARANDHPEWEADIRSTFARVWVEEVAAGTWYQDAGNNWVQK